MTVIKSKEQQTMDCFSFMPLKISNYQVLIWSYTYFKFKKSCIAHLQYSELRFNIKPVRDCFSSCFVYK